MVMNITVPRIPGKIGKKFEIDDRLHSIRQILSLMKRKTTYAPVQIIRADSYELRLLRDVAVCLSKELVTEDLTEIALVFNISLSEVRMIIERAFDSDPGPLQYWREGLEKSYSLAYAWDVEKNCYLSRERAKKIFEEEGMEFPPHEDYELMVRNPGCKGMDFSSLFFTPRPVS